uniref:glutaminase n=1 Tax=Astyanax mexicanus TaxID=7994 RepID=A0A8B9RBK1_ASTMX
MLQFRLSTALKKLLPTSRERPLTGIVRHKGCFSSSSSRSSCPPHAHLTPALRSLRAGEHRALPRTWPPWRRPLCTKTEGAIEPSEPAKKDETVQETTAEDKRRKAGILPSLEDLLFYTIAEGQERIPAHKFITALKATGLRTGDPRLKECMDMLKVTLKSTSDGVMLDRHLFKKCVQSNIVLLTQAFRKKFVIPDFMSFAAHIDKLYDKAKNMSGGQVADYIPQLAKFSPDLWAVSLCTVDGQRHTVGDTKVPFCLQSCVKPLKYAIAVHDHGTEYVHRFIGKEPSGLRFNKLFLDEDDKPHNPMVNAGAIVCTSLIKVSVHQVSVFQSERESGDRNFAIGYYLKEKKCFPEGTDMTSILDFYFQVGLPAKSGVAGGILLVVPNVMGIMCWSPPLDKLGNSVRGIQFCQDLVSLFNFHNYDNLRHFAKKLDPRREGGDQRVSALFHLIDRSLLFLSICPYLRTGAAMLDNNWRNLLRPLEDSVNTTC